MKNKKDSDSPYVIFADDDLSATNAIIRSLSKRNISFETKICTTAEETLKAQEKYSPEVVVVDLSLDEKIGPQSGLDLISKLIDNDPSLRVFVLTGHGSDNYGLQAIHRGAASFLQKPVQIDHLLALLNDAISFAILKRKYKQLSASPEVLSKNTGLKSASSKMQAVLEKVAFASSNSLPVLLLGETGTGKGVLAQAIFSIQTHHRKNLVSFYPSFVSQDLVNSELFGHHKGAFTGATEQRIGLVEEVNGGTLFVDEVADLPKETQLAMLRLLQEKKFRRLGSNKEISSDFRLICATNQEIEKLIKADKFRTDFYHRIAHIEINIPPLRERKEDIPLLAETFIRNTALRENLPIVGLSASALSKLTNNSWPGNIRQLQACVENGVYYADYHKHRFIEPEDLELYTEKKVKTGGSNALSFREKVQEFEIELVSEALAKNDNNQSKAAKELQLDRTTLRRILSRKE